MSDTRAKSRAGDGQKAAAVPPQADPALAIAYRKLTDLTPYARNARLHSRAQIDKIKDSLQRYGWTNPMLIADGTLIAGHARLAAALELAAAGTPIRRHADASLGPTVDLSHLNDDERIAYIIADNRLAEEATWDRELLNQDFLILEQNGFPLDWTGFDPNELATVRDGWNPDWAKIEATDAELAAMLATIRVKCRQDDAERVRDLVRAALADIDGVTVEK
jgi:ParB-like chromosome segregation protein Spo0J